MTTEDNKRTIDDEPAWYAMSATFNRELKAKDYLESNDVKCFIPMRYEIMRNRNGIKTRKLIPAVHNLLFAYTTKKQMQELKAAVGYLQYMVKPSNGKNVPVIVPQNQMEQFMRICDTHNEKLVYLTPDEVNLAKGTNVKIIGGAFDGVEGVFVKVEGKRKKRVVVILQGLVAVATAEISDGFIQVLD